MGKIYADSITIKRPALNGTEIKGEAVVNNEPRNLSVYHNEHTTKYVKNDPAKPFVEPKKNVVNIITVEEVKKMIDEHKVDIDLSNYYTKQEIDYIVETLRKGMYQEVDTEEYPTLEDFLESVGEEGIVYLYPIGNEGNNYYQYLWESQRHWIDLGATTIDLSNYVTKNSDQLINVINASDIVSNTLTQAQYDLITNGKPTLIKGSYVTLVDETITNMFLMPVKSMPLSGSYYGLGFFYDQTIVYVISVSTKIFNVLGSDQKGIKLRSIISINNKYFPNYPTTNTNKQVPVIGANGGALGWEDLPEPGTKLYKHDIEVKTGSINVVGLTIISNIYTAITDYAGLVNLLVTNEPVSVSAYLLSNPSGSRSRAVSWVYDSTYNYYNLYFAIGSTQESKAITSNDNYTDTVTAL